MFAHVHNTGCLHICLNPVIHSMMVFDVLLACYCRTLSLIHDVASGREITPCNKINTVPLSLRNRSALA